MVSTLVYFQCCVDQDIIKPLVLTSRVAFCTTTETSVKMSVTVSCRWRVMDTISSYLGKTSVLRICFNAAGQVLRSRLDVSSLVFVLGSSNGVSVVEIAVEGP